MRVYTGNGGNTWTMAVTFNGDSAATYTNATLANTTGYFEFTYQPAVTGTIDVKLTPNRSDHWLGAIWVYQQGITFTYGSATAAARPPSPRPPGQWPPARR